MSLGLVITTVFCAVGIGIVALPSIAAEPPVSPETVVKEAQETVEAAKQYSAQQKEAFQRKAQEELAVIQRQILELRAKIEKSSETTRGDLQKSINELQQRKEGVRAKLDELKGTTDTKWRDLQEKMKTSLDELKHSYHKLLSRIP